MSIYLRKALTFAALMTLTCGCDKENKDPDADNDAADMSWESPIPCDDHVACTLDECDPETGAPINTPDDTLCDDGAFCNGVETCDAIAGCRPGTPEAVDDGVDCTVDYCDEAADEVVHLAQDDLCDDGAFCNGVETCDEVTGCVDGTSPVLDDGIDCTLESCDETRDVVLASLDHSVCDDDEPCNGDETCVDGTGCTDGTALVDGTVCGDHMICLSEACATSTCGDGYVDESEGEKCEDGNADPLDGCDDCRLGNVCNVTGSTTLGTTTTTHTFTGTLATTDPTAQVGTCGGYRGHEQLYEVFVDTQLISLSAWTSDLDFDSVLHMRGGPGACEGEELACNDNEDYYLTNSFIQTGCLEPGFYYVWLDAVTPTDLGTFSLNVEGHTLHDPARQIDIDSTSPGFAGSGYVEWEAPNGTSSLNCWADGPEQAWTIDLAHPVINMNVSVDGVFYPALHLRTGACDPDTEVVCVNGMGNTTMNTGCLDAGAYVLFVDTEYPGAGGGDYDLTIATQSVSDIIGTRTGTLTAASPTFSASSSTAGLTGSFNGRCGGWGPEEVYALTLDFDASNVSITMTGTTEPVTIYVRHDMCDSCDVACVSDWGPGTTLDTGCLPAGTYYVFADNTNPGAGDSYDLAVTATAMGAGETCAPCWEAQGTITLDTTHYSWSVDGATDPAITGSMMATCSEGSPEAPEHVYELVLDGRFRDVRASTIWSSFDTTLYALTCTCSAYTIDCNDDAWGIEPQSEIWLDCPEPGTYWIVVDGLGSGDAGDYHLEISGTPLAEGEMCGE